MGGFIILPRSCIDWSFRNDHNTFSVAIHLLMMASYIDTEWNGVKIKRGQCVTSIDKLSNKCSLSVKQIRNILNKLEGQGFLARKRTNKFSIITICNYDSYQGLESHEGQAKGQSEGATLNNIYNKENNNVTINSKEFISEKSKKTPLNENYLNFIENIKSLYPCISDIMELPTTNEYIQLREKYTDNELLAMIGYIANYDSWHSFKYLMQAIRHYLTHKDYLPDFKNNVS